MKKHLAAIEASLCKENNGPCLSKTSDKYRDGKT